MSSHFLPVTAASSPCAFRSSAPQSEGADSPVVFTTSLHTDAGRLRLRVHADALRKLGAAEDVQSRLAALTRSMPLMHAVALRRSWQTADFDIDIRADDLAWPTGIGMRLAPSGPASH